MTTSTVQIQQQGALSLPSELRTKSNRGSSLSWSKRPFLYAGMNSGESTTTVAVA